MTGTARSYLVTFALILSVSLIGFSLVVAFFAWGVFEDMIIAAIAFLVGGLLAIVAIFYDKQPLSESTLTRKAVRQGIPNDAETYPTYYAARNGEDSGMHDLKGNQIGSVIVDEAQAKKTVQADEEFNRKYRQVLEDTESKSPKE